MSVHPFRRSIASVGRDGFRAELLVAVLAVAVLGGWLLWFLLAEIPLHEMSPVARIEVAGAAHHVEAPASGKVVAMAAALGRRVKAGDVLVELDATGEELAAAEQRALIESMSAERAALLRQIAAAEAAMIDATSSMPVAVGEAEARQRASQTVAARSRQQAGEAAALATRGLISRADRRDAAARARESAATATAQALEARRIALDARSRLGAQLLQLEELRRSLAAMEGEIETGRVKLSRLENDVERRTLVAPVDGTIGEAATLPIGTQVAEGDRLVTVVPDGELVIAGEFSPRVLGRIRPGQPALFRPQAFPSTQYGALRARVERVASEVRDGTIRVELALLPDPGSAIPLQHGLPGTLEIEVERVSPAELVWRALGRGVDGQGAAP